MAVLLILISFITNITNFRISRNKSDCFRSTFLKASITHGLIISVITELLSLRQSLTAENIIFCWSLMALINSSILMFLIYSSRKTFNFSKIRQQLKTYFKGQDVIGLVAASGVAIVLSVCLLTALVVPPHNYDAMTYHLPRVMHWIQNRSVAHYPTHNLRQISFPPGAGYIVAHLQILSGGDRFANCVQWLAFLGSVIGTSLISQTLGGGQIQITTALVCASIPMAIMQSTTTQTDLIVSFWLVCLVYFIFRKYSYSKLDLFWLSASLGLAVLTKPTGIVFGIPLVAVFCFRVLQNSLKYYPVGRSILRSVVFSTTVLAMSSSLSLPSYWRNYQTFGSFIGIDSGTRNQTIGVAQLASNILRNLALNMPISEFWGLVESLHKNILKIGVNEPTTTFQGSAFRFSTLWWRVLLPEDENYVGNPVHLVLLVMALLTVITAACIQKNKNSSELLSLSIGDVLGFLLFCLLLKWQEWGNRIMLPFFILSSSIIGYFICLFKSVQKVLSIILIYLAILHSISPLHSFLDSLPILSNSFNINYLEFFFLKPEDAYFQGAGPTLKAPYVELTDRALSDHCNSIGLDIGSDDWEYPIWPLMASRLSPFKIKHINVQNQSKQLHPEFPDSELCAIFEIKGLETNYVSKK